MKKKCLFLAALATVVSCAPVSLTMNVEMRQPSRSGLTLAGKNISVVCLDDGSVADSVFASSFAEGLADAIDKDYFGGEETVGVFRIQTEDPLEFAPKRKMLDLLVQTDADVVFLVDVTPASGMTLAEPVAVESAASPDSAYLVVGQLPFTVKLNVYDGMYQKDTVLAYTGKSTAAPVTYTAGDESREQLLDKLSRSLAQPGYETGKTSAASFLSLWKQESIVLLYYSGSQDWINSVSAAYDSRWAEAMKMWIAMLGTKDLQKRSCLEYNIAVACYVLGNYSLAAEWLDRSDKDFPVNPSSAMRRKINAKL